MIYAVSTQKLLKMTYCAIIVIRLEAEPCPDTSKIPIHASFFSLT